MSILPLSTMTNFVSTFCNQGWWKPAKELEVQAIETSLRVLRLEHSSTLSSMANLISTYWKQGGWKETEELEIQVIEMSSKMREPEYLSTLIASTNSKKGR